MYDQHMGVTSYNWQMLINPFILHSMPLVTDLLETCVDEVLRATVSMVTAEEVGPSGAYTTASTVTEETLSLAGQLIHQIQSDGLTEILDSVNELNILNA